MLFAGLAPLVLISTIGITGYLIERGTPDANITTPGDALWWGITTSSTVGYGDRFPVTTLGRILAATLMIAGVALIGVVSSYLASAFISPTKGEREEAQGGRERTPDGIGGAQGGGPSDPRAARGRCLGRRDRSGGDAVVARRRPSYDVTEGHRRPAGSLRRR